MKVKINVNNGSISAARVAAACGGRLIGDGSAEIGFVCTDSRCRLARCLPRSSASALTDTII